MLLSLNYYKYRTNLYAFAFYTVHDTERWSQVREPNGPDFFELFSKLAF